MRSSDAGAAAAGVASLAVIAILAVAQPLSLVQALPFLAVLVGLAALSPVGASAALVVTLPYFYHPISLGAGSFAPSEILLVATGTGAAALLAIQVVRGDRRASAILDLLLLLARSRLVLLATLVALIGLLAVATAFDTGARAASLREWRWSLAEPMLLVVILTLFATGYNARRMLAGALLLAGLVASLHGLAQLITDGGIAADDVRRLSGPLPHPNALALFLVKPLVLGTVLAWFSPAWRRWTLVPSLLMGVTLFGTFSRGAMLAVAAAVLIAALHVSRRAVATATGAAAGVAALALALGRERMLSALEGGSVSLRLDIWSSALSMIRDRPVVGYGPDQFLYAYAPRYIAPTAWDERFTSHAHNLVLDAWIRLGIAGAIIATSIIVIVSLRLYQRGSATGKVDTLGFAALIALGAALVHGLVDNAYFAHDLAMSSWLLAWLAFAANGDDRRLPT